MKRKRWSFAWLAMFCHPRPGIGFMGSAFLEWSRSGPKTQQTKRGRRPSFRNISFPNTSRLNFGIVDSIVTFFFRPLQCSDLPY
ncbi:hypothetical protein C8Q77DRAFT_405762 [Trametes polyzona]|nr:hypothetical protein C8Q77DRAFT_405762 [Trametes polyzona]